MKTRLQDLTPCALLVNTRLILIISTSWTLIFECTDGEYAVTVVINVNHLIYSEQSVIVALSFYDRVCFCLFPGSVLLLPHLPR